MRSSGLVIRAAIAAAAVAGCCSPSKVGTEVVLVPQSRVEALRAHVRAAPRSEPLAKEEEDLQVCHLVCQQGRGAAQTCQIHPVGHRDPTGEDGSFTLGPRPAPGRQEQPTGASKSASVAVDPDHPDFPVEPVANRKDATPDDPEYAAVCEMWIYPICGRRPADWQPPADVSAEDDAATYLALSARMEADSVRAFLDVANDLERFSAPTSLIRAAKRAAADERRHARSVSGAARRRGAHKPRSTRAPSRAPLELEAFATRNGIEGCTLEAFGAALAQRSARLAREPGLRRMYLRIAEEETRHAALSWAIHHWALKKLDPAARARVEERRRDALSRLTTDPPLAPPSARALLGLPDADCARAMACAMAAALGAHPRSRAAIQKS